MWFVQFYDSGGNRMHFPAEPYDEQTGLHKIPPGAVFVRLYCELLPPLARAHRTETGDLCACLDSGRHGEPFSQVQP